MAEVKKFVQGNEACVEGALYAGLGFFAGYPITPSTEIAEHLSYRLPQGGGRFIQMEDEIASMSAIIGASLTGSKAMTATSGPGFSLMQEALGYAVMGEIPCVVVDVQRGGPSTGLPTHASQGDIMQARWGMHGGIPTIATAPWSVQELYDGAIRAFNLAEKYRLPVLVMAEAATMHLRETLVVSAQVQLYDRDKAAGKPPFGCAAPDGVPPMPAFGEGEKLLVTASTHNEWGFRRTADPETERVLVKRLYNKVMMHVDDIAEIEEYYLDDADEAVIAYGFTARAALAAVEELRSEGRRVGLLRLCTLWPFPADRVKALSERMKRILVPEMNLGQMVCVVEAAARCDVIPFNQMDGTVIYPASIVDALRGAA